MRDIQAACESLGVTVCGGHTEITAGLERPIVVGHMLGELQNAPVVRKDQFEPGVQIIMTRGIAIEGTALIAREKSDTLEGSISDEIIQRAAALLSEPGISVVEAARIAQAAGDVRAMHDPTEGGVYTGLVELVTPTVSLCSRKQPPCVDSWPWIRWGCLRRARCCLQFPQMRPRR